MNIKVAVASFEKPVEVVIKALRRMRSDFEETRIFTWAKAPHQEKLVPRIVLTPEEADFRIERFAYFREAEAR